MLTYQFCNLRREETGQELGALALDDVELNRADQEDQQPDRGENRREFGRQYHSRCHERGRHSERDQAQALGDVGTAIEGHQTPRHCQDKGKNQRHRKEEEFGFESASGKGRTNKLVGANTRETQRENAVDDGKRLRDAQQDCRRSAY